MNLPMNLSGSSNPLAWIATHACAYPLLEVLHIVGIALLLGNLVLFDLRVWGFGAALPLPPLARLTLTLVLAGFGLAACSGLLMFATRPLELIGNRLFVAKMSLLFAAGLNAAFFHARGGVARLDRTARLLTLVSIVIWLSVIFCGRWIAYR